MPCECCTRRTDSTPTPESETWRAGHIVSFRPIGHTWGEKYLQKAYIFTITDADIEQAQALLQSHFTDDDFENHLRVYRVDFALLPQWTRYSLSVTGRAEVTLETLRLASRHAITHEKW